MLASSHTKRKRSIVFASFSGEEQGLLGSFAYVAHPLMPLRSTVAMLNVDHAAAGNGRLTIGVTGLEKDIVQQAGRLAGSVDRVDVFGFFPGGDHVPFKEAGIPTVTIVSGESIHTSISRPTQPTRSMPTFCSRSPAWSWPRPGSWPTRHSVEADGLRRFAVRRQSLLDRHDLDVAFPSNHRDSDIQVVSAQQQIQ